MDQPKVSVVIPVYNVERFLQRCIDSLLAQTYQNMELIFVDDGSKDGSYAILEAVACMDARIRVFQQVNAGVSAARNAGLEHSTGRYIRFCDSDDTVRADWCETLVHAITENPSGWIICGVLVLSEDGRAIGEYKHAARAEIADVSSYYTLFREGLTGSVYNKIYLAQTIREHRIRFDESLKTGEDVKFNLDYLAYCDHIRILPQVCYNYYRYEKVATLTNVYCENDFHIHAMLYRIRKPYIAQKDLSDFRSFYWRTLLRELERTMEHTGQESVWKRIRRNQTCIRTEEYRELLLHAGSAQLPGWQSWLLKSGRYDLYWMAQKLHTAKEKIFALIHRRNYE